MRTYVIEMTGKTGLLMHHDNIEWSDEMDAWKNDPANKKKSKPGDDRTPPHRWLGSLYHDGDVLAMPSDNLMACFREGGTFVTVPGGRSGKTFKAQTQSGMLVAGPYAPVLVDGRAIDVAPLLALAGADLPFTEHQQKAKASRFVLHVKRARIKQQKHVRVRPIIDRWSIQVPVHVWDEQITTEVLQQVATYAGRYKGIGDWRPGSPSPGSFGMFNATVRES